MMLWLGVQILLVAYLPGALILRLPGRSREYRGTLPADERVFWATLISVVWSCGIVLLLAALDRYTFQRLLAINSVVAAALLVVFRQHLRLGGIPSHLTPAALVPAAVVLLGMWLYFPPAEYVLGGKDPGTYINTGIQIAQRGQMVLKDNVVATVPPPFRDLFFPSHGQDTYYGIRFMGFFLQNPEDGSVVGQFPHLFPASIAIGYGFNGLSGARQAIGAWAILGLLAVYFTGVRLFGRAAAGAAAALLTINVVVVWFARYPNSELPMQALLFAALLAAGRARNGGGLFFAVATGALLGLTLFLRYEVLLAIMAFATAAVLAPVSRARIGTASGVALLITGGVAAWYLVGPMRAYAAYPLSFIDDQGGWWLIVAMLVAAIAVNRALRLESLHHVTRQLLPPLLAVAVAALALYAYFLRAEGGRLAAGDAMAFRSFGWYVTPPALLVAVVGACYFLYRDFWRDPTFYLTFVTFSTFFFYKTRIVPEHFWTSRRFLGVALPGAILLLAAFVQHIVKPEHLAKLFAMAKRATVPGPVRVWHHGLSIAIVILALSPTALAYWRASEPVMRHVEYAGLIPRLEQLAAHVSDRDLVLVEGRNAGTDLHGLAMPLAYIYARNVLVLDSPVPEKRRFEQFIAWAHTRYERVFFLGGGGTDLLTRQVTAEPVMADRFQVPEYDSPLNRYPAGVNSKEFEFGLYRVTVGGTRATGPVDLQIGGLDDLNVVRFYARERRDADTTYRWTGPQSFVLLTGMSPDARQLTVWMSDGGRPSAAPPAVVEVAMDDVVLGTASLRDAIEPFHFPIPADMAQRLAASGDPVRVRIRVPTWNPAQLLGGNDTRDLGVMLTRVQTQ